uniref:Transmembrane protein 231 n=1 Tax=Panagrolaimus sp. JU765 TaxID=591449 RepID=A0AC34QUG8_9BILA
MTLTIVHEEFITRTYKASKCSAAYFWRCLSWLLSLSMPLIICIVTQGLWKKTNTYLEQPRIEFTKKGLFFVANFLETEEYFFWSSFQELNDADPGRLIMPIIETQNFDHNDDGIVDEMTIDVTLNLPNSTFQIRNAFYYLEFKVILDYRSVIEMTVPIIGSINSQYRTSASHVLGDLKVIQKRPLPSHGNYFFNATNKENENTTMIFGNNTNMIFLDQSIFQYYPQELYQQDLLRNYTLGLYSKHEYNQPFTSSDDLSIFTFYFHFLIREQELTYRTSAMELLKWFWLQYFSFFVMIKVVLRICSSFLYENQIFPTLVFVDKNFKTD